MPSQCFPLFKGRRDHINCVVMGVSALSGQSGLSWGQGSAGWCRSVQPLGIPCRSLSGSAGDRSLRPLGQQDRVLGGKGSGRT